MMSNQGWQPRKTALAFPCQVHVSGKIHNGGILAEFLWQDMQIIRSAAAGSHKKA
jgi:hypothetical protein